MPQFAANLSLMYTELPFLERFGAAARDGFAGVEYLFPYAHEPALLAAQLRTHGLRQVLFNAPPGGLARGAMAQAWDQGARGTAALPGREAEFRAGVLEAGSHQIHETFLKAGKRKVSLIGWSLGGIYARELAKLHPQWVRCVITLGTPFAGAPQTTNAWRLFRLTSGRDVKAESRRFQLPVAPPVPTTSIFSRSDGIVAWKGSLQKRSKANPDTENIEVIASHLGIGMNPSAMYAVADRLAQPEGAWKAFDRTGALRGLLYPDPAR